jgi:hypothetical protein
MGNNHVTGLGSDIKEEEGKKRAETDHTHLDAWMHSCYCNISCISDIFEVAHSHLKRTKAVWLAWPSEMWRNFDDFEYDNKTAGLSKVSLFLLVREGNELTVEASGSFWRRSVTSVIIPSVPSLPISNLVKSYLPPHSPIKKSLMLPHAWKSLHVVHAEVSEEEVQIWRTHPAALLRARAAVLITSPLAKTACYNKSTNNNLELGDQVQSLYSQHTDTQLFQKQNMVYVPAERKHSMLALWKEHNNHRKAW